MTRSIPAFEAALALIVERHHERRDDPALSEVIAQRLERWFLERSTPIVPPADFADRARL